ncbi:PI-PLC domain-containing protein [Aquimarina mytili]|uniref:Phosphatidylinositol diacylglycerol-lyase n=1 Tax=Aquimarina mytili TaxID=874423 RepID=A0A937DB33_9FLAO|nr:hypothetical protein [Aquimarina mytili]MBL0685347.1 hypothetical protein [Aquimarina mytili]
MTYRNNDVYFCLDTGYALINGSYTIDSFSVTGGQDPKRRIYAGLQVTCSSNGKMTFSVGRKGSEGVANWFDDRILNSQSTFNHGAGKMNFAFLGTLKLTITGGILGRRQETFTFSNIAIAQGHSGVSNNWWFGGQNCSYIKKHTVMAQGINSNGDSVSFAFLRGGNDVSSVGVTPTTLINTKNWMGKLSDSTQLDSIMMPGSHDAGMSELHHCAPPIVGNGYVQTQSSSIGQQLVYGSRYFDIRVDYDHNELVTYHRTDGWGCNGQGLVSVLDQTKEFLIANPTETAFLKFSHIRGYKDHNPAVTKQKINDLLSNYSTFMYKSSNSNINLAKGKLGNVRGKMILVFNYSEYIDPLTGRFRYKDGNSAQPGLTVYDHYSNTNDYSKMSTDQLNKWKDYGGLGQGVFFLLSWTLTASPPGAIIAVLAKKANDNLPNVLYDQIVAKKTSKPNIVYVDYVDSKTTQSIILYNFDYFF